MWRFGRATTPAPKAPPLLNQEGVARRAPGRSGPDIKKAALTIPESCRPEGRLYETNALRGDARSPLAPG